MSTEKQSPVAKRQAEHYQNAKANGTLKRPIKVSKENKSRFDDYKKDHGLTVDEALNRLLMKVKY